MADPLETFPTLPGQFLLRPLFLVAPGTSGPRLLCLLYPLLNLKEGILDIQTSLPR